MTEHDLDLEQQQQDAVLAASMQAKEQEDQQQLNRRLAHRNRIGAFSILVPMVVLGVIVWVAATFVV